MANKIGRGGGCPFCLGTDGHMIKYDHKDMTYNCCEECVHEGRVGSDRRGRAEIGKFAHESAELGDANDDHTNKDTNEEYEVIFTHEDED